LPVPISAAEYLVVVGQAGIGQVHLRHVCGTQPREETPILMPHQRPVEPGVDVLAAEITDLEAVALAVVHRPDL
jgi:hypothetical protein